MVMVRPKRRWQSQVPSVWWYSERWRTSPMIFFEESMNSSMSM
jgi:hypothetical protein